MTWWQTDQPPNRPPSRPSDRPDHRKVTLPIIKGTVKLYFYVGINSWHISMTLHVFKIPLPDIKVAGNLKINNLPACRSIGLTGFSTGLTGFPIQLTGFLIGQTLFPNWLTNYNFSNLKFHNTCLQIFSRRSFRLLYTFPLDNQTQVLLYE